MNVLPTQNALFRQLDVAALVSQLQQAAEQAQRQNALSSIREAHRREGLVGRSEASDASAMVGPDPQGPGSQNEEPGRRAFRRAAPDEVPDIMDAPNISTLGHHFDVVG